MSGETQQKILLVILMALIVAIVTVILMNAPLRQNETPFRAVKEHQIEKVYFEEHQYIYLISDYGIAITHDPNCENYSHNE